MKLVDSNITVSELRTMSEKMDGSLVKAVVDIEKQIMVVDADLHADQESFLLENGSKQKDLWGINLYPAQKGSNDWIEFDSMINLRPSQNNKSRYVENAEIREKIITIINKLVQE